MRGKTKGKEEKRREWMEQKEKKKEDQLKPGRIPWLERKRSGETVSVEGRKVWARQNIFFFFLFFLKGRGANL